MLDHAHPVESGDRIAEALLYVSEQFSVSRDEFCRHFREGADMLWLGIVNKGFANERAGRIAVSPAGRRRINASEVPA